MRNRLVIDSACKQIEISERMAEREGFEPPVRFPVHLISRILSVPSYAQQPTITYSENRPSLRSWLLGFSLFCISDNHISITIDTRGLKLKFERRENDGYSSKENER
jgi:hypothetical protein